MKKIIYLIITGIVLMAVAGFLGLGFSKEKVEVEIERETSQTSTSIATTSEMQINKDFEVAKPKIISETPSEQPKAITTEPSLTESKNLTPEVKKITLSEVALHNKKEDCWLVINGEVLDVTNFIPKHPGGEKILKGCGLDATELFNKIPGHAKSIAQSLLKKYKIGEVK